MRYAYIVILKKTGERATDLLSILLSCLSAVIFLYVQLSRVHPNYGLVVAAVILAALAFNAILGRKGRRRVSYRYLLLVAGMGWIGMPFLSWVSIIFAVLAFLEYQAKRPLEIGFDQDRVIVNSLFRQRHDWSEFNHVVLKDGLLTLDFKNNRLVQKEVADDDDDEDVDEEEFNTYCRERLAAAGVT